MTELRNGVYATSTEELSALALEARRRGISYGHLVADITTYEQQEIIRDYCEEKAGRRTRRRKGGANNGRER